MSLMPLSEAKTFLDVIHDFDDVKLQALLDGAEDEALRFMNRKRFGVACPVLDPLTGDIATEPTDEVRMPASVNLAVKLLLQAMYQATPQDAVMLREAAKIQLFPYRCGLGVF